MGLRGEAEAIARRGFADNKANLHIILGRIAWISRRLFGGGEALVDRCEDEFPALERPRAGGSRGCEGGRRA